MGVERVWFWLVLELCGSGHAPVVSSPRLCEPLYWTCLLSRDGWSTIEGIERAGEHTGPHNLIRSQNQAPPTHVRYEERYEEIGGRESLVPAYSLIVSVRVRSSRSLPRLSASRTEEDDMPQRRLQTVVGMQRLERFLTHTIQVQARIRLSLPPPSLCYSS